MIPEKYKYKLYGRFKGRKKNYEILLDEYKKYEYNFSNKINKRDYNILDIGSGSGENSLFLSNLNPNAKIIACDVFEDGNVNLCNQVIKNDIENILFFQGNIYKWLDNVKSKKIIDEIWILFPDPWPKIRHHKRRLVNYGFLNLIYKYLKINGKVMIASDSPIYNISILKTIYEVRKTYFWKNQKVEEWDYRNLDLPRTKFYKKAQKNKRKSIFFELHKI